MTERVQGLGSARPGDGAGVSTEVVQGGMDNGTDAQQLPERRSGWLVIRRDGIIVTAEQRACDLLGAPDADALTGRDWASLLPFEPGVPVGARVAMATGSTWTGRLTYCYARDEVVLETAITPVTQSTDLCVVSLEPTTGTSAPAASVHTAPAESATPVEAAPSEAGSSKVVPPAPAALGETLAVDTAPEPDDAALTAQIEVLDALHDLTDPAAAARAVLQALRAGVPFDWGTVLRFQDDSVAVIATYPSPMAGIAAGVRWSPPSRSEASVWTSGEPSMEGDARREDGASPLSRLPGFGLGSRVLLPLYAGADVAGMVVLYRAGSCAFDARAGILAERTVRRLGEVLGQPTSEAPRAHEATAAPPVARASVPSVSSAAAPASVTPVRPSAGDGTLAASRLESLGELVAGVAHELNNPLTAILGYAQIVGTLEDDERDHALRTIEAEALRASRIVRNLLAFARQRPGERQETDLEALLRRIVDVRRYSLEVDDVHVVTRFGHVPMVRVDEGQFEQVFFNLLSNAHQAMHGRGGEIVLSTWTSEDQLYISFADDGPGVPDEMRTRVFDPFFTTREEGAGEGMGLSIAYGVVTNHGGRTWVETSPSGGANFIIQLPLDMPEATSSTAPSAPAMRRTAPPASSHAPEASTTRPHILVVDDEAPVRALTREILSAQGYPVSVAENGQVALQQLEVGDFGLVITDLRMPGLTGADLYHEIEQRWPHLRERVLFVTGDIEGNRGDRALDRERINYLEKPFTTQQLLAAIRGVLDAAPPTRSRD